MLKRGKYIGEIIDCLAALQTTIQFRTNIGLTDTNKVCEDFFREILNIAYMYHFENTNKDKPNFTGVDLVDKKNKTVVQITSRNDVEKIKESLTKVDRVREELGFSKGEEIHFIFFMINIKKVYQSEIKIPSHIHFDYKSDNLGYPDGIIDIHRLLQKIIILDDLSLHKIYQLFDRGFDAVYDFFNSKDELEITQKAIQNTSIEIPGNSKILDGEKEKYLSFLKGIEPDSTIDSFNILIVQIEKLPLEARKTFCDLFVLFKTKLDEYINHSSGWVCIKYNIIRPYFNSNFEYYFPLLNAIHLVDFEIWDDDIDHFENQIKIEGMAYSTLESLWEFCTKFKYDFETFVLQLKFIEK